MDRRRAGALLALAACIACSAAAPTASNHTALDLYDGTPEGCYYNFQHYGEGDRIMTNEPCLNCTCHNRMLMCYLRVCPFTKPIGQDCTIEKRADQCCPIVTCPDVPVDLLTSTSTTSPAEYGATGLGKLDKYGCSISGKYFPEGSKVPPTPNKPCEHCYCIRNMTTCVMQECTLHVDGCTPIYHKDVCCPVRYSCDHPEDEMPLLDDMSTTVRPTPGFLLTTTTLSPVTQMTQDCVHDDQVFADGAQIKTEKACEHCYCMKGDIVCVVQECGTPMENEGKNCTSLPPREGQCCPDTYICEGDELGTELPMDLTTESVPDGPTTLLPPRRTSVEGSGYRNEPDEVPYINIPTIQPEHEGSGEEQETSAPYDATEKLSSEKPVDIDDFITATKEDQYASYTTKSPSFEVSEDTTANEISGGLEPQEYIPVTTNIPVETGYEINTTEENVIQQEVTEKEYLSPHEPTSDTLASEMYDKMTTEPGEALNTVTDAIPGEQEIEQHKHVPSPTVASAEENEKTTPLITDEEIATSGYSDEKTIKPEHSFPSPSTIAAETSDSTKEHDLATVDSITEKETEAEHYVPSTPSTSTISEIKTVTPELHEKVTSVDIGKETDGTEPNAYASSTISIPTEKGDEATSEPDHDQNTVAVVDEDNIYHHLHTTTTRITLEEEAGTTLHSIELGSGTEDFTEENILEPYEHVVTVTPSEEESIKTTSEPDRGLNTIPSEIVGESSSEVPIPEKTTISQETIVTDSDSMRRTDSKPTIASESSTISSESTASRADHFTVTTEPSFRKEDESSISTEKSKESEVTTGKIDFSDEGFIPTSSHDEKLSTGANVPSIEQEFTTSTSDNEVQTKAPTTESILVSSISSTSIPEKLPELPSEQGTESIFETPTTEKVSEITTLAAEIETHEEPGRIPGEGDCLLNGITYRNNSIVPSTNNCHSGCKCVSSIVKCDPIICSPPPDYMDNCQSIYDSPDSCCPTYVCDHPRETVPPQSDNQMSGTESPQPSPTYECRGDQCEINISTKQPVESSDKPESHDCGPEGCKVIAQKPGDSKYPLEYPGACKDGKCPSPAGDCSDGKCEVPPTHELVCDPEHGCQAVPVRPCDGENCETTSEETAKPPHLCENKEDCKDVTPCEGDSCKFEVSSPQDTQQVSCKEDGCKSEQVTPQECSEESCKKNGIPEVGNKLPSECKGSQCVQQTETVPKEGPQDVYTESSVQDQTPFEVITDKAETNEDEHKITESQKEAELTITEQPHIVHHEISTEIPEIFTVSHEIVSESESPVGSNEIYTNTPDERHTTPSESYVTESDKSPQTTEKAIGTDSYTNEIPESQTTKPIETIASDDKGLSQTTDHITIPENIDHRYTTVSSIETAEITTPNIAQSEMTKLPEFSSEIPTVAHEFGTQTTLSSLMHESSIQPESDVEAEKATITSVTTESVQVISKSTEPTTEEEYGFTDNPEYELPGTKTQDIEPIQIEPQDGTTESQKPPTGVQESTTRLSTISEYITEKEQIGTKLPIEVPKVTEFVSDEKQTESPEQSDGKLEQPITRLPVDIISSEDKDTDASPVIKEHMTDIPLPFTNEPETSFTEIEDSFVTGRDQTTTEKSIPDATISLENFDKSTQVIEPSTTEKVHDIVEMSLPSSEKPLHPDSLSVGVTELQEISTKATEQEVTDKQQDSESQAEIDTSKQKPSSGVPPAQESSDIELPKSEKPDTEEKYQSTERSVTENNTSETSEHLSTNSQESITKQPHQYEEITELSKSPITESQETFTESPIVITTASKESLEPIVVTGHEEKTTYAPETEDIQVHLSTTSPEIFTEQETGTELPHKEYSKLPGSYITESYDTEAQDLSTKMEEPELFKTTTEIPRTPDIKEVSTDEPETELQKLHTESDIQKQSTDSSIAIEGMRTESPISQITTKQDESRVTDQQEYIGTTPSEPVTTKDATIVPGYTQVPEATLSEGEVQTTQPIHHVPVQVETITKTPEDAKQEEMEVTIQEDKVTEAPEESKTEVTRRKEDSTKAPQDIKESEPQVTILEEAEVTKAPEDVKTSEPDVSGQPEETPLEVTSQEEAITKAPEVTKESELDVTSQEKEITKAPDDTEESLPEITKHEEEVTKSPEDMKVSLPEMTKQGEDVTKVPEDIKESLPESTEQEEAVTKGPEDINETLPQMTTQEEEVTKAPEDMKESLPEITGLEKEETKSPGDMKDSVTEITSQGEEVTKAPADTKDSVPEITGQGEDGTKAPEDTRESVPEITSQGEDVTKAPEDTKEYVPEITSQGEEVTKAPEDTKESVPEIISQEEGVTKSPADTKESVPEITSHEEEVTKAPEDTKDSVPEITSQGEEVTKAPEDTKDSVPEITSQGEEVTKAPEDTKESVPEITRQGEEVTKAPEDTKESVLKITGQGEDVTKAPEDTKESVPEISSHEEEVTKAPEDTKDSVPEITSQGEEVTKAPEDTKESVPEITSQEEEVTKAPEDTKESVLKITGQGEDVTKAPEDTKESVHEITGQGEDVTNAAEDTKESVPEITSQGEESTKAPEDTKDSVPDITSQEDEVTKAPERTQESVPENTSQGEEVTEAPEDKKESVPEITSQGEEITKVPEGTQESVPETTSQGEEVIKASEDSKESVHEITGQGEDVTKAPEDTKESVPEITSQGEEVTKSPEDTKESVPEITGQGEDVTKAPEDTKESMPEITSQEEEVTKAPEDTKESVPEIISQEEGVTKAPADTKESVPEITSHEEEVTKAPEDTKDSVPEITSQGEEVTKAPEDTKESVPEITSQEEEVTKAPEDTKESVLKITGQGEDVTKAPEDTKESVPEITSQGEEVTKAPEDTKESVPEITSQEEEVTKAPEDMKESVPKITGQGEDVTKAPEDTKESVPEITSQGEEVTKAPEDMKESMPNVTGQGEEVTKAPEDTKESVPEITGQEEDVTKAAEDTKESVPEITSQGEEVTNAPEDTKESVLEITGQGEDVTKAAEDTKESVPEITSQGEEVTKAPEDTKDSVPDITSQEDEVTKAPERTQESVPESTSQGEEVTEAPEDKKESVPDITSQGEEVTKAPEDTKESVPEITSQGEEITKSPEDTKESVHEITSQGEEVTKAPEGMKESVPEITSQGEEVTKAPEDTKESVPEISSQGEEVTTAPEDTKYQESLPEVTSEEEKVTRIPERVKESESEVTELSPGDLVTEKLETTPTLLEIHIPHDVSSDSENKVPEDTTYKQVEEIATEQPIDQFSATTPDVIILEEHTHKIMEESSTPSHEERTTLYLDTVSEVTSQKPIEESIETVTKEVETPTKAEEGVFTVAGSTQPPTSLPALDQITEKVPEGSLQPEETPSDHKVDDVIKEREPTLAPALEETTPSVHIDSEKSPTPDTKYPVQTEKIPSATEKPVHHEIVHETTVAEDELIKSTTKATTTKQEEVTVMPDDKLTKPGQKPVETSDLTPSAPLPELTKPVPGETQPTDELPTPEEDGHFPPSGMTGYGEPDYVEEDQAFGPGTCRYGGKVYVSAQQIPRDDPCDFCFCFRSDIICLQQSCPPPIHGCHEEPIQGFCCPRYECHVSMATTINMTTTTTTTTTTLPPHFPTHSYKGAAQRRGCQIKGHTYKVGEVVRSASGPCLHCTCGGDGQMKCDPKACTPEPMLRQMIAAAVSAKRRR